MKLELNKVYKDIVGTEWRVTCISEFCVFAINKYGDYLTRWDSRDDDWEQPNQLVELVGDNFTEVKELRKFEFEGYIVEFKALMDDELITNILEDRVRFFHDKSNAILKIRNDELNEKISKWKMTMEELPNE